MKPNGSVPHDEAAIEPRRHVALSRAASRRALAAMVHDKIIPAIVELQHNDRVTQDVCKSILTALDEITAKIETLTKKEA